MAAPLATREAPKQSDQRNQPCAPLLRYSEAISVGRRVGEAKGRTRTRCAAFWSRACGRPVDCRSPARAYAAPRARPRSASGGFVKRGWRWKAGESQCGRRVWTRGPVLQCSQTHIHTTLSLSAQLPRSATRSHSHPFATLPSHSAAQLTISLPQRQRRSEAALSVPQTHGSRVSLHRPLSQGNVNQARAPTWSRSRQLPMSCAVCSVRTYGDT